MSPPPEIPIHKIILQPDDGIVWVGSGGGLQAITANRDGKGVTVKTELTVPIHDDGTGIPAVVVMEQVVKGWFGTNFNGARAFFGIGGQDGE